MKKDNIILTVFIILTILIYIINSNVISITGNATFKLSTTILSKTDNVIIGRSSCPITSLVTSKECKFSVNLDDGFNYIISSYQPDKNWKIESIKFLDSKNNLINEQVCDNAGECELTTDILQKTGNYRFKIYLSKNIES